MTLVNFLMVLFSMLGICVVLGIGVAWFFARNFCKPKRRTSKKTPAAYGLAFDPVAFLSQGVTINGWFIPTQKEGNAPQPTIVIAHGWSASTTQLLPITRYLHVAGYNLLLYNARGHGTSGEDGPITLQKFAEDLIAAIDYLEGRADVDMDRLGVVGHSMGGSAAILAASMDSRVRVLVSSAAFADPQVLTAEFMQKHHIPRWPLFYLVRFFINRWLVLTNMTEIAPKNRIGGIKIPTLLIHGEADAFIPPQNMAVLQSQNTYGVVQSWLMSGGLHHSTIIQNPEYGPRITTFFESHLPTGRVQIHLPEPQLEVQCA